MPEEMKLGFLNMSAAQRRTYYTEKMQKKFPEGNFEYVSVLGYLDENSKDISDVTVLLIACFGGKQYLLNADMELISADYDAIRPFAKKGFNSLLFEVTKGGLLGLMDNCGKLLTDVKYEYIHTLSLTRELDGPYATEYIDLFDCIPPQEAGGGNDVYDECATLIFSGLCGIDECEVKRSYKHFTCAHEVGGKYYSERVESLYIYREYDFSTEECPDDFREYAFRVSVFDMMLGGAEIKAEEQADIRYRDYPRQRGKLTVRRDYLVPSRQFDEN